MAFNPGRSSLDVSVTDIDYMESIGHGSLGDVYRARHLAWGPVWIRRMNVNTTIPQTSSTGRKLRKEAEMLKIIHHKNIVQLMGIIWHAPTRHYALVFEPAPYGFLSDFLSLEKNKGISVHLKIAMMYDIALGMSYLHSLSPQIIHRDLRWQNIQVSEHFILKIADFGLAGWVTYSRSCSSERAFQGPTYHIAPESWENINIAPNIETDVYSYGILSWIIATQEEPYRFVRQTEQIRISVVNGQRPSLDSLPADCPHVLIQWIKEWWHQSPQQRPPFQEAEGLSNDVQWNRFIVAQLEDYVRRHDSLIEDAKIDLHKRNKQTDIMTDGGGDDEDLPRAKIHTERSTTAAEKIMKSNNDLSGSDFRSESQRATTSAVRLLSQEPQQQQSVSSLLDLETDADESPDGTIQPQTFGTQSQNIANHNYHERGQGEHSASVLSASSGSCVDCSLPIMKESSDAHGEKCIGHSHRYHGKMNDLNKCELTKPHVQMQRTFPSSIDQQSNSSKSSEMSIHAVEYLQIGENNVMNISSKQGRQLTSATKKTSKKVPQKIVVTSSRKVLDGRNMEMLTRELGANWKQLARKLDFSDGEIDAIDHDNFGLKEKIHQFLRLWIQKHDRNATLCAIADALIDLRMYTIAGKLDDS